MNAKEIFETLGSLFPDDVISLVDQGKMPFIKIRRERILPVMRFLRDDESLRFDFLQLVTGLDYPDHFESVYHLYSYPLRHAITIKADIPRDAPIIDSVESVWRAADWHERETFDLMGIIYQGHPDLRRILCPEDWAGHPLRKDYVQPEEYHGISNVRRIGDDWYPKPDEDAKAIIQFKPQQPSKPPAS